MSRLKGDPGLPRMMSASVPTIFNVHPSASTDYENASSVIHWSAYYRYRKVGHFTGPKSEKISNFYLSLTHEFRI